MFDRNPIVRGFGGEGNPKMLSVSWLFFCSLAYFEAV